MKLRGAVSVDIPIQKPNYEFVSIWSFKGKSFKDFAEKAKKLDGNSEHAFCRRI